MPWYALKDTITKTKPVDGSLLEWRALARDGDPGIDAANEIQWPASGQPGSFAPINPVWVAAQSAPVENDAAWAALNALTPTQLALWNSLKAGTATLAQVEAALVFVLKLWRADLFK